MGMDGLGITCPTKPSPTFGRAADYDKRNIRYHIRYRIWYVMIISYDSYMISFCPENCGRWCWGDSTARCATSWTGHIPIWVYLVSSWTYNIVSDVSWPEIFYLDRRYRMIRILTCNIASCRTISYPDPWYHKLPKILSPHEHTVQ